MLTIDNVEKIIAINSQQVEVMGWECEPDFYEFIFEHDNIHSTQFKVHMHRRPQWQGGKEYIMELWDYINHTPLVYQFTLDNVKDPFTLLNYLKEVLYDWDNVTNK